MCTIEMIENIKIENSTKNVGVCHFAVWADFDENSCMRDINYEPQGRFSSPEPNMFGGDAGTSPGERPHDVIAGESPARRDFPR